MLANIYIAALVIMLIIKHFAPLQYNPEKPESWPGYIQYLSPIWLKILFWLFPFNIKNNAGTLKGEKILFVGNRQLAGSEIPVLYSAIQETFNIFPRITESRIAFLFPFVRQVLSISGAIIAEREVCDRAMRAGMPLLILPGGHNEAHRKKNDCIYTLRWGNVSNFARMALQHGYTIVPVTSVGADELLRTVYDVPISWLLRLVGDPRNLKEFTIPLVIPSFTSIRTQYVNFGEKIETDHLKDKYEDEEVVAHIIERTKSALQDGLKDLKKMKLEDLNEELGF